jgi:ATP phosphoribosyltransferase regulatory subunit
VFGNPLAASGTTLKTPKGMGDLLPPEANARRALTRVLLQTFERSGYHLITTPLFEHASVVERGADSLDPRELLRFVEPESGEVAVLRPDITPQIARVVATRLADHPAPFRLCYEGRVIRRRRGRARNHQQITQAGVECIGLPGVDADIEVLRLAQRACENAGLSGYRVELSHVSIAHSLLATLPGAVQGAVSEALARKDHAALEALLDEADVPSDTRKQVLALVDQYGDLEVLSRAERTLHWPAARAALANLRDIVERLAALGPVDHVGVDLSDARGSSYYTGMSFTLLAEGPGEVIGAGGRYDNLLARFGADHAATGFAFDLENLQWALRAAGVAVWEPTPLRLTLSGQTERARHALAEALRERDVVVATLPDQDDAQSCLAFAQAWGYDASLLLTRSGARLHRACDGGATLVAAANGKDEMGLAEAIVALKKWAQEAAQTPARKPVKRLAKD